MNIFVLGGTGRVGSFVVELALRDQHKVTVLVRSPEKIQMKSDNLKVIKGDALNYNDVVRAMEGANVVISALNTDGNNTLSKSMPLIIEAMKKHSADRIITVGTAGILQSRVNPDVLRYQSSESRRKSTTAAEDHEKAYRLLSETNFDWTIVCPTYLPMGEQLRNYRAEREFLPEDGMEISVPDTAEFTYSQLQNKDFSRCRVGISY